MFARRVGVVMLNNGEDRKRWRIILLGALLLGCVCFILGITLPMMTVKKLVVVKNTFTILQGIGALLADKTFLLGIILLIFSVLFPLAKFIGMIAYVALYPPLPSQLTQWQSWLSKLAKFSMLDVFVVGQMLMILKLGWLVEVTIHSGIYWFSAAVILSMIAGIVIEQDIYQRIKKHFDN